MLLSGLLTPVQNMPYGLEIAYLNAMFQNIIRLKVRLLNNDHKNLLYPANYLQLLGNVNKIICIKK